MLKFVKLTANYEKRPIGLTKAPILHWQIESDGEYIQEYFKIRIFSEKTLSKGDIFDSGEIKSGEVLYNCENVKLKPFSRYFWSVEVKNEKTGEVAVSEKCEFVTSVLNRSQWTADIFRTFECMKVLSERKVFEVKGNVEKAYIFIAATGEKSNGYNAYINKERISDDLLMPGPMEYMSMRVRGYDITEHIREKNVINIDHLSGVSVVLKIFTDKGEQIIQTDKDWEAYPHETPFTLGYENCYTPTRHHGKYELYNSLKYNKKWYDVDYVFGNAKEPPICNWGPIKLRYLPTSAKAYEPLNPVNIIKKETGFLVDFGKIQSGYVKLTMHNQKSKVKIQYAESVVGNELCFSQYANEYLPVCEYIPSGLEKEVYSPYFMHTSFRYVLISGLDGVLLPEDIRAFFIHSDVLEKSDFSTDDSQLEYIYKCIERSYKSNLIHIPTDCPGRERRGWTGDSFAVIDSQCFMYDVYNLYDRWLEDLHDNQRMNGWCTVEYPDQTDPCIDLNWPMHIIIVPWKIYRHYGNIEILKKNIDSMEKYCELLFELSDEYLFAENLFMYGDWVATDRATASFMGGAMFYYVTKLLSLAEKELGREDFAKKYALRAEKIKNAVNGRYLVCKNGVSYYDKNSQSANTLALAFDICPENKKKAVLSSLINNIEKRNEITVGFIANTWLYEVLAKYGKNDFAYRIITDGKIKNSMASMVNAVKSESLSEEFSNFNNSLNHAFLGGGTASWIYACYGGIKIEKPGYKEFTITPYFAKETDNFYISLNTPFGELSIKWKRTNGKIDVSVVCPHSVKGRLTVENKEYELVFGENEFCFTEK